MDPITRLSTLGASGVASGYPPGDYWLSNVQNMDPGGEVIYDVNADSSGNIYAVGTLPGGSFLVKKDHQGVVQWAKKITDTVSVSLNAIAFDGTYLYVSAGSYNRTGSGNETLVLKFDTSGTLIWQKSYSENTNTVWSLFGSVVDSSGNLYLRGRYSVTGGNYIGVMKINSSGTLQWAKGFWNSAYGPSNYTIGRGIDLFSNGDVALVGEVSWGSGSGMTNGLMARLNGSTGNATWANQWQETSIFTSIGNSNNFKDCKVDSNDNVYAIYEFQFGLEDIAKFNSSGAFQSNVYAPNTNTVYIDYNDNIWANGTGSGIILDTSLNRILIHNISLSYAGSNMFSNMVRVPGSDVHALGGTRDLFTLPLDGGLTGTYNTSWGDVTYSTSTSFANNTSSSYKTTGSLGTTTPSITTTTTNVTVASLTYTDKPSYLPPYP